MKKLFLLLFYFATAAVALAQPQGFIKNFYGNQSADLVLIDIDTTHDGGYIMCGRNFYPGGNSNFIVIKTDSLGNEQWRFTNTDCLPTSSLNANEARKVKETSQYDIVISATIHGLTSPNLGDVIFCKLDSLGNLLWKKQYDFATIENATALEIFDDSTYLLAGSITGGINQIIKVNYWGDTLWTKQLEIFTTGTFIAKEIVLDTQRIYISGSWDSLTPSFASIQKPEVFSIDFSGNLIWCRLLNDTAKSFYPSDYRLTLNKHLFLAYINAPNSVVPKGSFTIFKLDTTGNLLGQKLYFESNKSFGSDIFFNDSCLINYNNGSGGFDSINLYKYNLHANQNINAVNYAANKIIMIKCVVTRNNEVSFLCVYSDAGYHYSILVKTNQSFIGIKNIIWDDIVFRVYPNPADDRVTIEQSNNIALTGQISICFFEAGGKVVLNQPLKTSQKQLQIKTKNFPSETYTYQIKDKSQVFKSGKIIIAH